MVSALRYPGLQTRAPSYANGVRRSRGGEAVSGPGVGAGEHPGKRRNARQQDRMRSLFHLMTSECARLAKHRAWGNGAECLYGSPRTWWMAQSRVETRMPREA